MVEHKTINVSAEKTHSAAARRDVPVAAAQRTGAWGSDAIADLLRALGLPYVCINPGSSFRGLHDSLVNHLGNQDPQMLLCLHEEHAVAIAHGWAKVTGRPLGVIMHANVGLLHATMAIFDAWCDRVPVVVLGGTGPVDPTKRRPWIDWTHTSRDQGAVVRHYTKWDDQPVSIPAAQESLLRAAQIATTAPRGPVYICLDAALQEAKLESAPRLPDVRRFQPPPAPQAARELVEQAARWLCEAQNPVILMGRVSREEGAWQERLRLAETLGATVLTDLKVGAAFPTDHPLHGPANGLFLSPDAAGVLKAADVVLSLDWVDLAGTLKQSWGAAEVGAKVIQVSVDQQVHNGWSLDHQGLPPTDLYLFCEPGAAVPPLLEAVQAHAPRRRTRAMRPPAAPAAVAAVDGRITTALLAQTLREVVRSQSVCLTRLPNAWSADLWCFRHPLDYIGFDGGAGLGSGPAITVGAALALKGSGRLPIGIMGDGDYLMGVTALWTAANARVPLLVVVANNNSFFNDELHQERVAKVRGRPVENRWIGMRITDPEPDLLLLARGQGVEGVGPVEKPEELPSALAEAVAMVRQGKACVVDVRVAPGYPPAVAGAVISSPGRS